MTTKQADNVKAFTSTMNTIILGVCGFFLIRLVNEMDKMNDTLNTVMTKTEVIQNKVDDHSSSIKDHNERIWKLEAEKRDHTYKGSRLVY